MSNPTPTGEQWTAALAAEQEKLEQEKQRNFDAEMKLRDDARKRIQQLREQLDEWKRCAEVRMKALHEADERNQRIYKQLDAGREIKESLRSALEQIKDTVIGDACDNGWCNHFQTTQNRNHIANVCDDALRLLKIWGGKT